MPFLDYAINQNIATHGGNNLGVAMAAIQYPTSIVLNLETNRNRGCAGGENWNGDFIGLRGAPPAARNSCLTRHNEGSNYDFVDGHMKWAKAESFKEAYVTAGSQPYWFVEP